MAIFAYKAMNQGGRVVMGQMDAVNVVDLEMRLKRMELDLINGNPVKQRAFLGAGRISRRELCQAARLPRRRPDLAARTDQLLLPPGTALPGRGADSRGPGGPARQPGEPALPRSDRQHDREHRGRQDAVPGAA